MMRWCDEDELPHDTGNHCVHAVQDEHGDKWVYRLGGFGLHGEWHADVLRRKWRTRCDGDMIPSLEESDEDLHRLGEWEEVETTGDGPGSMRQMGRYAGRTCCLACSMAFRSGFLRVSRTSRSLASLALSLSRSLAICPRFSCFLPFPAPL